MAITQAACSSYKQELALGLHNFSNPGGNTFKIALYTVAASLDATVTSYTSASEVSSANYAAGGTALSAVTPAVVNGVAVVSFATAMWTAVSFSAAGALIYNSSNGNRAVCVLSFGTVYTPVNQNFTIQFPVANDQTAIIRIA